MNCFVCINATQVYKIVSAKRSHVSLGSFLHTTIAKLQKALEQKGTI